MHCLKTVCRIKLKVSLLVPYPIGQNKWICWIFIHTYSRVLIVKQGICKYHFQSLWYCLFWESKSSLPTAKQTLKPLHYRFSISLKFLHCARFLHVDSSLPGKRHNLSWISFAKIFQTSQLRHRRPARLLLSYVGLVTLAQPPSRCVQSNHCLKIIMASLC